MKPVVIQLAAVLDGPPDVVWRLLTDWERQGDWMREARDFEVVSSNREGVGVEALATVRIAGVSTRDRIRVDVWEPSRRLGIRHLGWVAGRGDLHLTQAGETRTQLEWREELEPPWGIVGAIGIRVFRPLLARTFRRDVRVLNELVQDAVRGRYPKDR